jgi:hypothetical protein
MRWWWQLNKSEADLERELRCDLELEEEQQRAMGLPPEEARHAAQRAFGNDVLIKEQIREAWGWVPFDHSFEDLRYALRQFRRSPWFAFTGMVVLAVGVGVSVAIFGFVDAALLEPLPYRNPSRLMLHRFAACLVGGFALVALLLGVIGLYGVTAYAVSQRTREIGVRMALGAQRSSVYRLVLGQAGLLTAAGLAIGLLCSVGTSMLIRKLLFSVQAWDVATLTTVAFVLALASLAASLQPAHRAASVDPVQALRGE